MKAQNMTNIIIFYAPERNLTRDDGSRYLCRWNSRSFPLMKLKFCRFMFISTFSSPFPWLSFVFVPSFKLLSLVRLFFRKTLNEFCCLYQATIAELLRNVFCAYARLDPGPETKAKQIRWEKNFVRVDRFFPIAFFFRLTSRIPSRRDFYVRTSGRTIVKVVSISQLHRRDSPCNLLCKVSKLLAGKAFTGAFKALEINFFYQAVDLKSRKH